MRRGSIAGSISLPPIDGNGKEHEIGGPIGESYDNQSRRRSVRFSNRRGSIVGTVADPNSLSQNDPRQSHHHNRRRSSTSRAASNLDPIPQGQDIGPNANMRMTPQMVHMQYEMRRNHTREQELKRATAAAAAAAAAVRAEIKDVIGDNPDDDDEPDDADDDETDKLHDDGEIEIEDYSSALPVSRHSRRHHQRSNSPIIVWRPNLRVKIATDIPEELLRTTSLQYDGDQLDDRIALSALLNYNASSSNNGMAGPTISIVQSDENGFDESEAELEDASDSGRQTIKKAGYKPFEYGKSKSAKKSTGTSNSKSGTSKMNDDSINKSSKIRTKKKYGAWYIPPTLWADYMKTGDDALKLYNDREQKPNRSTDYLSSKLVDLYSSKMYKEYIMRAGYRLPHYLEGVQVNSNEGVSNGMSNTGTIYVSSTTVE